MNTNLILVIFIFGAACIASAVFYYMREVRIERRRWARYSDYRGGEPKSAVCPHCRKRTYSLRAIRERLCIHCNRNY